MDIEALKLTEEEIRALHPRVPDYGTGGKAADAQLAKALWGLVDWLEEKVQSYPPETGQYWGFLNAKEELEGDLEAAGIPRPEKISSA